MAGSQRGCPTLNSEMEVITLDVYEGTFFRREGAEKVGRNKSGSNGVSKRASAVPSGHPDAG